MSKSAYRIETVLAWCVLATAAQAEDEAPNASETYMCKSSNEVREINVYRTESSQGGDAGHCRIDYIKNGATRTVWSAATRKSYCDGKAAKLIAILESSHFSCQRLQLGAPPP